VIIIENEPFVLKQLERLLHSIDEIDLRGTFSTGEDALDFLAKNGPVDIIFSDIEMEKHSGLELAKFFSNYCDFLVFITGYEHYALQAFDVDASGYLLKPVTREDLLCKIQQFAQLENSVLQKKKALTSINVRDGTTRVLKMLDLEDVFSMESNGNYININTETQTWLSKNTMKNAEKRFCRTGKFIRISQSVIIAINKLDKIQENRKLVLTNEVEFLISRRYLKQLQELLSRSNF
jgi:DNA-binding LytR/AlgR family response regulator